MGTACWYALFFAITQIPLANATLLTYSAPLWMPLIAWVVTRQRVARATWMGAGRLRRRDPGAAAPGARLHVGELSALAGAVFLAVAMMSVRWLGATEPMTRVLFYYFLLSTVMAVPIAIFDWQPVPAAGVGLVDRARLRAAVLADPHRGGVPLRLGGEGRAVHLLGHRVHRSDRLDRLGPSADAVSYLGMALVIGGGLVAVRAKRSAARDAKVGVQA